MILSIPPIAFLVLVVCFTAFFSSGFVIVYTVATVSRKIDADVARKFFDRIPELLRIIILLFSVNGNAYSFSSPHAINILATVCICVISFLLLGVIVFGFLISNSTIHVLTGLVCIITSVVLIRSIITYIVEYLGAAKGSR